MHARPEAGKTLRHSDGRYTAEQAFHADNAAGAHVLEAGFILREDIIKLQWKMKSTRERWFGKKYDFYLIGHEHLYVFRKPEAGERVTKFRGGHEVVVGAAIFHV